VKDVAVSIEVGGQENRLRILRAAEQLMADRGIDGVSLREVNRAAEQGNASAIQYYFGDRDGLLHAVLDRHQVHTDPRRHALLDDYEAAGTGDLRMLASALVIPLVERLKDPDGGRAYLQVAHEFYSRAQSLEDLGRHRDPRHSMPRWHRLVTARLPEQEERRYPSRYPAVRLVLGEIARRARGKPRRDDDLFSSILTDGVAVILDTPASTETTELLRQRAVRRR
jgi:AcrR family transcriptional regulator